MRYSDRGKLTDAEAAELRARFRATVERAESRGPFFTPSRRPRRVRSALKWVVGLLVAAALVALVVWGGTVSYRAHKAWVSWCHAAGGAVTSTSDVRVGTAIVNGKITTVITTDTTYYCLADGNRLLGIRS